MVGYVWAKGAIYHAMLAVILSAGGGNGLGIQPTGLCEGRRKEEGGRICGGETDSVSVLR